jgi:hypothetical protein
MAVEIYQRGPEVWEQRAGTAATLWTVFDYIADFGMHVDWERDLLSVKVFEHRTGVPGANYLKTYGTRAKGPFGRMFNRGHRVTCKLRQAQRPHHIAWRQYRSHQAAGPSSFQQVDFAITPNGTGSLIVLTRMFSGDEGISSDMVARYASGFGQLLHNLPPELRAAAGRSAGNRPGLFSSPEEIVWHMLEGHPSHGPGPSSLERLIAILDGLRAY